LRFLTIKGKKIDKSAPYELLLKEDKLMLKEEARAILEKSEELASWTDADGITHHQQVGDLSYDYGDCFGFAVYPYSSKEPINPDFAFQYFVYKDNGEIVCADAPMVESEFKHLGRKQ
jgi:hypothetical protein